MPRFICPHCHSPLDPQTMDRAGDARSQLRICPICDEPVVLSAAVLPTAGVAAVPAPRSSALAAQASR